MRRLACALALAALLSPAAAHAAVSAGAYGNTAHFDRLTGQHTESGLVFLGWDQGRSWGSKYEFFLNKLGERPHLALHPEGAGARLLPAQSRSGRVTRT
jgi:hypothetical protein